MRASTSARLILPPHNPAKNFRLATVTQVLAGIDAARSSEEGLAPWRFDAARFARLSVAEQIFMVTNLEGVSESLFSDMVMVRRLDTIATQAALCDLDPYDSGASFSSIWSNAPASLGRYAFSRISDGCTTTEHHSSTSFAPLVAARGDNGAGGVSATIFCCG